VSSPDAGYRHPADLPGPLAFVDDLEQPFLDPADRHHLERVLRLRIDDPMTVADGAGRWRACRFGPSVTPAGEVVELPPPDPPITICFGLVKAERPELIVQKLTELGVDRIVAFTADRSVVRWDAARAGRNVERLRAIARSAAAQCHRPHLPAVGDIARFSEVAALDGAARCERLGAPPALTTPVLLVGPEGGWSPEERAVPLPVVGLGSNVLRTETAAMTAGAVLSALRDGIIRPGEGTGHVR
jgi:16S rRNA (uracil1498-N3)-methyltransferase